MVFCRKKEKNILTFKYSKYVMKCLHNWLDYLVDNLLEWYYN